MQTLKHVVISQWQYKY